MKPDATSLDRLHDIVVPELISWWPPAPGWYALFAVIALVVADQIYRGWKRWRSNAYRREALQQLEYATTIAAVSELLRRTALAFAPRALVASLNGSDWANWLQQTSPTAMNDRVQDTLTIGLYWPSADSNGLDELKTFAADWIRRHDVTAAVSLPSTEPVA